MKNCIAQEVHVDSTWRTSVVNSDNAVATRERVVPLTADHQYVRSHSLDHIIATSTKKNGEEHAIELTDTNRLVSLSRLDNNRLYDMSVEALFREAHARTTQSSRMVDS